MQGKKRRIITAAVIIAVFAAGCYNETADWDDTLPAAETEKSRPTVVYLTEETTESTEQITIATSETTKRTAFSETGPALATTTEKETSETKEGEISTVPGVPNVPISEFTSTTPLNLAEVSSSSQSLTEQTGQTLTEQGTTAPSSASDGRDSDLSLSESSASGSAGSSENGTITADDIKRVDPNEIRRPYSYDYLTEKQVYIYDAIITAAEQHRDTINFSSVMDITAEEYCDVYQIIYDDEQALFYIDTKMQYAVNSSTKRIANATVFYKYNREQSQKMLKEIEAEADKILAKITPDMTDYDKVKLFNDELASNVVYDETAPNCRDIYGVFVGKRAICGGFSKAFSYLCGKVGIQTATVTGDADGQPHMWNKVKIDGKWYNVDVTYAVSGPDAGGYVRYDYFCVPDEMLASSREVYEQPYEYPKAVFDDCSYYVKNGLVADSWEDVRSLMLNQIVECAETKETVVQVKCSSKEVYEEALYYLFDSSQKKALDIMDEALPYAENKYSCNSVNYNQDATSRVIKIFLEYS